MKINTLIKETISNSLADLFDSGFLKFYTGGSPGPNLAATGTLLATIDLENPAFTSSVDGVVSKLGVLSTEAIAAGDLGYCRMESADGLKIVDLSIELADAEVVVNKFDVVVGTVLIVNSLNITMPSE